MEILTSLQRRSQIIIIIIFVITTIFIIINIIIPTIITIFPTVSNIVISRLTVSGVRLLTGYTSSWSVPLKITWIIFLFMPFLHAWGIV